MEKKAKVGRPRINDSQRVVFQRVPIRLETYQKLKAITDEQSITYTDLIEAMLQQTKLG